jgi:hypothetical protein
MTVLAEAVDAVVGGDTHRDTHALEMIAPNGTTIAVLAVGNDDDGFAEVIAWIAEHAPGPRVAVGLEGTRSYGVGLARAVAGRRPARRRGPGAAARGPPAPRQVRPGRRAPGGAPGSSHACGGAAGAAC